MSTTWLGLGAAFVMGLMGSTHCVLMCGPLAALSCARPRAGADQPASTGRTFGARDARPSGTLSSAGSALVPQLGRLSTYGALGALSGAFGASLERVTALSWLQLAVRVAAGLALIVTGLALSGLLRKVRAGASAGAWLSAAIRRLWTKTRALGTPGRYVEGLLWGLMPCGLVYAALALALGTGSAQLGAGTMVAFGAGTLPALLGVSLTADAFQGVIAHPKVRLSAGLLLALAGALQVSVASGQGESLLHPQAAEAPMKPCCAQRAAHAAEHPEGEAERP